MISKKEFFELIEYKLNEFEKNTIKEFFIQVNPVCSEIDCRECYTFLGKKCFDSNTNKLMSNNDRFNFLKTESQKYKNLKFNLDQW